jgi:hypothetical protein
MSLLGINRLRRKITNPKRIVPIAQPQARVNNCAIEIDGRLELDVTEQALDLTLAQLQNVRDHDDSSDRLVDVRNSAFADFEGPFTVLVEKHIESFVGVAGLGQITTEQQRGARLHTLSEQDAGATSIV